MQWLLTILTLLLAPSLAWAQFAYPPVVQSNTCINVATCTFDVNVTAGNLLIVGSVWQTSVNAPTVSDSVGTVYGQQLLTTGGGVKMTIYSGTAGGTGANTVTVTVAGATFQSIFVGEFPPYWSATAEGTNSASVGGTPSSLSAGNVTTTVNHDLLFLYGGNDGSGGGVAPTGSYTLIGSSGVTSTTNSSMYLIAGVPGVYNGTVNTSFGTNATAGIAAFPTTALAIRSPATLPAGVVGVPYSYTLQGSGGTGALTWSITAGALPAGLSIAANGAITGTPTVAGTTTPTFRVTDGVSNPTLATSINIGNGENLAAHVQDGFTQVNGNTSIFISNVTTGHVILVAARPYKPVTVMPCRDTQGTLFHPVTLGDMWSPGDLGPPFGLQIYGGVVTSTGPDTVTCWSVGIQGAIIAAEFSNIQFFSDKSNLTSGISKAPYISDPLEGYTVKFTNSGFDAVMHWEIALSAFRATVNAGLTANPPNQLRYTLGGNYSPSAVLIPSAPYTSIHGEGQFTAAWAVQIMSLVNHRRTEY